MKLQEFNNFLTKITTTVFFIGYLPLIPGTFGSLAALGLFYLLKPINAVLYFLFIICILLLGLLTCTRAEKIFNKKDPGCIVIDEVMGMLIALSFMPLDLRIILLAFIFFRIIDSLKPFPASRIQNMHGAVGIMGDDLVAGIYTNIVLQVILKITSLSVEYKSSSVK